MVGFVLGILQSGTFFQKIKLYLKERQGLNFCVVSQVSSEALPYLF